VSADPARRLGIDVFTLFPSWFGWLSEERHVQNALAGPLRLAFHNLRDHSPLRHRMVDDEPYGGGAGMLMRVDCVVAALEGAFARPLDELRAERRIVVLDPGGRAFDDAVAREYAAGPDLVLLAGRYEGFDHRVHDHVATEALSLGPFVLSGGEVAAMAVVDAVARFLEGSLGDAASSEEESFSPALDGLVEYPHYTRPPSYRGWEVPEVLLSGHHGRVAAWRREQAEERTRRVRGPRAED
jgi:tRNA (guanine37-N1)-methyltransferase